MSDQEQADEEARIALVFGCAPAALPEVDAESLLAYHAYLAKHLAFPFEARYDPDEGRPFRLTATGLERVADLPDDFDWWGLFVAGKEGRRKVVVPLGDLTVVDRKSPQFRLVSDYGSWFWNHR